MFGNDRQQLRQQFFTAWQKYQQQLILTPLEDDIAALISHHPEYHFIFADEHSLAEYEANPPENTGNAFLHLSLHLSVREQISTDRPAGIQAIYQTLLQKIADSHEVEHRFITCLGEVMWEIVNEDKPLDEQDYLERLKRL